MIPRLVGPLRLGGVQFYSCVSFRTWPVARAVDRLWYKSPQIHRGILLRAAIPNSTCRMPHPCVPDAISHTLFVVHSPCPETNPVSYLSSSICCGHDSACRRHACFQGLAAEVFRFYLASGYARPQYSPRFSLYTLAIPACRGSIRRLHKTCRYTVISYYNS